jgi:hypothetical protein
MARKNLRQVFTYLKEAYTVLLFWKAGSTYTPTCRVSVDARGIPKVIPVQLRNAIDQKSVYIGVASILGIHRVVPWWPKVDLSTIENPFSGAVKTLPINTLISAKIKLWKLLYPSLSLRKYYSLRLRIRKPKGIFVMSAGPNGPQAQKSIIEDALAFWSNPLYAYRLIRWYLKFGSFLYPFLLVAICLTGLPLVILRYLLGKESFHLGRLGVVYNTAGKSRVIAMTNWWVQVALKPLHTEIFSLLKKLETDGTFNQLKPLQRLIESDGSGLFSSLDLSAATDRLPLDLQRDVLCSFTDVQTADLWRQLISIPFAYKGRIVKYAVGQPMGAYSSWAMLALTHHMVIQACSVGSLPSRDYAILGDDIVIRGEALASSYVTTMTSLGVGISLPKSIKSENFLEFAKRLISSDGDDFSIVGPGLILSCIKIRDMIGLLVAESYKKGFVNNIPDTIQLLDRLTIWKPSLRPFGLFSLLGLRGALLVSNHNAVDLISRVMWLRWPLRVSPSALRYSIYEALHTLYKDKVTRANDIADIELKQLKFFTIPKVFKSITQALLYCPLLFLSPGPFLTILHLERSKTWFPTLEPSEGSWEDIIRISGAIKDIQISKLDSLKRQDATNMTRSFKTLHSYVLRSLDELCMLGDDFY